MSIPGEFNIPVAVGETGTTGDLAWQATFYSFDLDCPLGWGATAAEAIADLITTHGLPDGVMK